MSNVYLTEEDKRKLLTPYDPNIHYASSEASLSPKRLTKLAGCKTEAEKLRQDAIENLHIDPFTYTLNKGKKTVHSCRSLFPMSTTSSSLEQIEQEMKNKLVIKKFHYDPSILVRLQVKSDILHVKYLNMYIIDSMKIIVENF